jgi:hypothetical protein
MKRRRFGLLAGSSLVAMQVGQVRAQSATPDASQLGTTLTPMGAEMAGNADGSIPAWTGGMTALPAGVQQGQFVGELFPSEQPMVVIDASNMADHAERLSEGVMAMMTKYGFKIKVYPTHRTAAAPQYVYDNIKANVARAQLNPGGARFGFSNAYGGVPFPIPDQSDPLVAGAQVVWNYATYWQGKAFVRSIQTWAVSDGQLSLAEVGVEYARQPYYVAQSLDEFNNKYHGVYQQFVQTFSGPANDVGQVIIFWQFSDPYVHPQESWELLNGQGRVRRTPEVAFDTPSPETDGIAGYDEFGGFNGSLERYDWKLLGKQEMYLPYNNNGLYAATPQQALLAHFIDPDLVRWEKHRVWVVEATLHPGERNVLARRKLYFDEDTWIPGLVDGWDGHNALFKVDIVYNRCEPGLPGVFYCGAAFHNLQTDDYASGLCTWDRAVITFLDDLPDSRFDPNNVAASAQY